MTFEKVSATVQAIQDASTEDLEAENKPATTNQTVARFEPVKPRTKGYWATVTFFSLCSIPGFVMPLYYHFEDVPAWATQMAIFSLMWAMFGLAELARFAFKQDHTGRAICLGSFIYLANCFTLLVVRLVEGDDE